MNDHDLPWAQLIQLALALAFGGWSVAVLQFRNTVEKSLSLLTTEIVALRREFSELSTRVRVVEVTLHGGRND
jgi:hypothetical protein